VKGMGRRVAGRPVGDRQDMHPTATRALAPHWGPPLQGSARRASRRGECVTARVRWANETGRDRPATRCDRMHAISTRGQVARGDSAPPPPPVCLQTPPTPRYSPKTRTGHGRRGRGHDGRRPGGWSCEECGGVEFSVSTCVVAPLEAHDHVGPIGPLHVDDHDHGGQVRGCSVHKSGQESRWTALHAPGSMGDNALRREVQGMVASFGAREGGGGRGGARGRGRGGGGGRGGRGRGGGAAPPDREWMALKPLPRGVPAPHRGGRSLAGQPRPKARSDVATASPALAQLPPAFRKRLEGVSMHGKAGAGAAHWYDAAEPAPAPAPSSALADASGTPAVAVGSKRKRSTSAAPAPAVPASLIAAYREAASGLLRAEVAAYEKTQATSHSAEGKWLKTVLAGGTASDRLAALTLLVQASPLHALRHLDALLAIAQKKGRRESQQALDALKDLFVNNLLPAHRKLIPFSARPVPTHDAAAAALRPDTLVAWLFEDELKARYASLLTVLEGHLADAISHFKTHALQVAADLLSERPEQEAALLTLLVNKLGDPEGRVSSKAQHLLLTLLQRHPAMKPVVMREARQFLIRPHLSDHAQYFVATFLNQIPMHRGQPQLAIDSIHTFFSLFRLCMQRGTLENKLLSAVLTGINRAFPYAMEAETATTAADPSKPSVLRDILTTADELFVVTHRGTFIAAVQALALLLHIVARSLAPGAVPTPESTAFVDRFYRALYSKLTLEDLATASKFALVLNTVYRALKLDPHAPRARAIVKRMAQVALHMPAHLAAGVVFMVAELLRNRRHLVGMLDGSGVAASPPVQVAAVAPAKRASPRRDEEEEGDSDDSDSGGDDAGAEGDAAGGGPRDDKAAALAVLRSMGMDDDSEDEAGSRVGGHGTAPVVDLGAPTRRTADAYDPTKREPKYAGADAALLWELAPLALHYHPSVRKFADDVMANPSAGIAYDGDPLADFTVRRLAFGGGARVISSLPAPSQPISPYHVQLMSFLDRFVFKNPKKQVVAGDGSGAAAGGADAAAIDIDVNDEIAMGYALVQGRDVEALKAAAKGLLHGSSVMQRRASRHGRADTAAPATSSTFLLQEPEAVAAEDRFMHTFFRAKAVQESVANRLKRMAGVGVSSEGDADAVVGDSDGEEDEDGDGAGSEASMDRYADMLAERLMASAGGGADRDADFDEGWDELPAGGAEASRDDDDHDDDDGDGDDDSDGEDDDDDDGAPVDAGAGEDDDEEEEEGEERAAVEDDNGEDDDDEDDVAWMAAGDDSSEEDAPPASAPAAKRSRKTGGALGASVFAAADDYDDQLHADAELYAAAIRGEQTGGESEEEVAEEVEPLKAAAARGRPVSRGPTSVRQPAAAVRGVGDGTAKRGRAGKR